MTKRPHDNLGVVYEFLKFAFFFLRDVTRRRVVAVLDHIALGIGGEVTKAILKVANFRGTERVIGSCEYYCLRPVILFGIAFMLLQTV